MIGSRQERLFVGAIAGIVLRAIAAAAEARMSMGWRHYPQSRKIPKT
jgi:hypothetical protein